MKQKTIKPLYFYHVVNKNSNMSLGLLSLQYMYNNKQYDLFDKYSEKYKKRIVKDWNIEKYQNRVESSLTREEILDALNIYRGPYGTSQIFFFRYPPKPSLGPKVAELLKYKDIYRIDINNPKTQKYIKDIFYGYEESHSDNKKLDRQYYENITEEKYFAKYDDKIPMNFMKLNHISIAFKEEYCPIAIIEKLKEK